MKTNNKTTSSAVSSERVVEVSRALSIQVDGGMIEGEYCGYRTRVSRDGVKYSGWIIAASKAIAENRETKKPEAFQCGRYFVFGATRLDRILQEVQPGEKIRITYLGKEKNETPGADGTTGQHHAYKVVYID